MYDAVLAEHWHDLADISYETLTQVYQLYNLRNAANSYLGQYNSELN